MQYRLSRALVLLAALFAASCAEEKTTEEYLASAEMLSRSGDYNAALIELKNAALEEPFNVEVRRAMAYAYLELGFGADAEKEVRRAQDMGMNDGEAALVLARALMVQGKYEEVLEGPDEFDVQPEATAQSEIMAWRGVALMELGEFELAAGALGTAVDLDADSALALAANGSMHARLGNVEQARKWADEALQADAESPQALALQGDLLFLDGDLEGARKAYTQSIQAYGYPTLVNARRAMTSLRLDDLRSANTDIATLRRAGFGNQVYVLEVQGIMLYKRGDYAAAEAALSKAIEAVPSNIPMRIYLAMSLLAQERYVQAELVLNQLYEQVPNSWNVAQMQAQLALQDADIAAAREALQSVRERSGEQESVTVLGMLGALAMIEGDPDSAIGYFEEVLALVPDNELAAEKLVEAQTMRGDFIDRDVTAARGGRVDEAEYSRILLSAAAAMQQGRTEDARVMAENLSRQFPGKSDPLKIIASLQLASGDFESGVRTMESILAIAPYDPSTTRNLAKVYNAMGEQERAASLLTRYLEERPQDSASRALLSGLIVESADAKAATAQLQALLEQDPGNHSVRARLVKLHFEAGELDRVIVLTEQLEQEWIVIQPSLVELRGKAFVKLGQTNMAAGTWEQWLKAAPDSALANYFYGQSLMTQGQTEEAVAANNRAVELDRTYLPARTAQVRMAALAGDLAGARKLMEALEADLGEDQPQVKRLAGWLALQEQDYAAAESVYRWFLARQPDPEVALLLAATLSAAGDQEGAMEELERWRKTFPYDLQLLALQAQGYMVSDPVRAIGLYKEMLEVAPDSVVALNNLAWLLRESEPASALDYARRAHELAPDDPVVLDTYGSLLVADGKIGAGSEMLSGAVQARPQNMQYRLNYARALVSQGQTVEAVSQLERVMAEGSPEVAAEARALRTSLPGQ